MANTPWLAAWNYRVLVLLFRLIPHARTSDSLFDFLVFNHLVSTWIFAACFYIFWAMDDPRRGWRRGRLLQIFVAFWVVVLISLVVRPWIAWPPPLLNPAFRPLYPSYFWVNLNLNSFPSHATLAYFMIAAGIWPLKKWLSVTLGAIVLAFISLPRIYVGGHYPIDVLASLVLVIVVLPVVWRWKVPQPLMNWLLAPRGILREFLLILWVFELGEGFRGVTNILQHIRRLAG